jgi:hypothetical protein
VPLTHDRQFQMRVSDEFVEKIDEWRRSQADIPGRAEAIRRLVSESLGKASPLAEIGEQTAAGPHADVNLDGVRRAIIAWAAEQGRDDRDDPDIDDATIAIYEEAANDLVTDPNLDTRFGYWIDSELSKLVKQKRKGAGRGTRKRRSQDQPTLKGLSGSGDE